MQKPIDITVHGVRYYATITKDKRAKKPYGVAYIKEWCEGGIMRHDVTGARFKTSSDAQKSAVDVIYGWIEEDMK